MICPTCKFSNIEGEDSCESCGESLTQEMPESLQRELADSPASDPLSSVAQRPAVMVSPRAQVGEVVERLLADNASCALVIDGGTLVGICSERDLLYKSAHQYAAARARPISEIMTPNPQSLDSSATVAWALNRMDVGGFRHVPIVENGRPIGMVSVRDLLAHLASKQPTSAS